MKGIGEWFRKLAVRLSVAFQRFMQGRYGGDKLNIALIWVAFAAFIVSLFIPFKIAKLVLLLIYYGVLALTIFRFLSRNTYKRYQENRKFLRFFERLKDREHKHFDCPRCRQPVRVPRGKGKILITCPKCKEKFTRKS